jgi:hypothetical protein
MVSENMSGEEKKKFPFNGEAKTSRNCERKKKFFVE